MRKLRIRGIVIGVLLATCAAVPATASAQAGAPTLTTTTTCLDPQSTVDQYVDVTATGLVPFTTYVPLLEVTSGTEDILEVVKLGDENVFGVMGTLGAQLQFSGLRIAAEASVSQVPSIAMKVGFGR